MATTPPITLTSNLSAPKPLSTGASVREASRTGTHKTTTSGLAPTYLQANLIILPSRYASDFRLLCTRNPVPCPLIAESSTPGSFTALKSHLPSLAGTRIADGADVRTDAPKYMVYKDSKLEKFQCDDIMEEWTPDHVAFLIGCSFSFESALTSHQSSNLTPRHTTQNRTVPMYRTSVPLCPAGIFTGGTYVVSMRPYKRRDIEKVRQITRPFTATHGEPIAWGWDAVRQLGIKCIGEPEWGDAPNTEDGRAFAARRGRGGVDREAGKEEDEEVPVFWGCGVTPQEAVMRARLQGTVMGHAPGHMLVLDARDWDIVNKG